MIARSLAILAAVCLCGTSANALTMKECSAKFIKLHKPQALSTARNGTTSVRPNAERTRRPLPAAPRRSRPHAARCTGSSTCRRSSAGQDRCEACSGGPGRGRMRPFPNAVDAKYSKETACGKARMHTCLDQYNANKAGSGNGGMKWIQKGGGFYSECNKHLKEVDAGSAPFGVKL